MNVFSTERLNLRYMKLTDDAFILELLNDPDWLRFIGDRGVHTLEDARHYIETVPMAMIAREGFGLWLVERRGDHTPIGVCGLIRRPRLADVDLGFAFLPAHRGQGYAFEAAEATLQHAKVVQGLARVVAITSPGNTSSIRLLEKLGMRFEKRLEMSVGDEVCLFGWSA